jgi:2-amino-4-hydroxy-6-hydroxymethyldihydropteridine diphosphokinase
MGWVHCVPHVAWLGLGSNLGGRWGAHPNMQVQLAIRHLNRLPGICVMASSAIYRSPPMGPADQPDYANAVVRIESRLSAPALLAAVKRLEQRAGRDPHGRRWGERALDIDLLAVDTLVLQQPGLTLPHPGIMERPFVLVPWAEIAPDWVLPGVGTVAECAARLPRAVIQRWDAPEPLPTE